MSKKVSQSFSIDTSEVQKRIERGTQEINLPSNRYLKVAKMAEQKRKKKNDDPSEVLGWTQISEEQDFGNSDFEALIDDQTPMQRSHAKFPQSKKSKKPGAIQTKTMIDPASLGAAASSPTLANKGKALGVGAKGKAT